MGVPGLPQTTVGLRTRPGRPCGRAIPPWPALPLPLSHLGAGRGEAVLTTSMKSVGEVMAIGRSFKESLQKALLLT